MNFPGTEITGSTAIMVTTSVMLRRWPNRDGRLSGVSFLEDEMRN